MKVSAKDVLALSKAGYTVDQINEMVTELERNLKKNFTKVKKIFTNLKMMNRKRIRKKKVFTNKKTIPRKNLKKK